MFKLMTGKQCKYFITIFLKSANCENTNCFVNAQRKLRNREKISFHAQLAHSIRKRPTLKQSSLNFKYSAVFKLIRYSY